MEGKEIDTKRLLLFLVFMIFFIISYQFIAYLFIPKDKNKKTEDQQTQEKSTVVKIDIKPQSIKNKNIDILKYTFKDFDIYITPLGGRIYKLVDKKYNVDLITEKERNLNLLPLQIATGNGEIDNILNSSEYKVSIKDNTILMELKRDKIALTKILEVEGNFIRLKIESKGVENIYINAGTFPEEPSFYTHHGPVIKLGEEVIRMDPEDIKDSEIVTGEIKFAGEESRYMFKGFLGSTEHVIVKRFDLENNPVTFTFVLYKKPIIFYAGAKEYARLRNTELSEVIDFGKLKLIVKPIFYILYWVYEQTGSWIFSIIVLTILVRIFMFPLGYKSTVAMMKLSKLAPRIEEIRQKYKKDPVRMQEEMMKLYKEAGFNPASGCLPILLQIPIFFALYKVLIITVDLKLESFFWISSLAEKDPFYILPILMGGSMILQQKLNPNPDTKQNIIMYISAIVFTFLFASFPSGLVFYWTLNNLLNIVQNYIIKKVMFKTDGKKG